ncbi:MAG: hypothetical protein ABIN35_00505 [candidate division WOR-3 bacterium]
MSIEEVYGPNYHQECKNSRINHVVNMIASSLVHRQLNFRLFNSSELWDKNKSPLFIQLLKNKVHNINKMFEIYYIDKQSNKINMLPELIDEPLVEYFWILDKEYHNVYFIFITPNEVGAF